MEDVLIWVQIFGAAALWILVFWFSKLITNLKAGIDAQNNIISSFKSHSGYLSDVQSTLSNLYDPNEIENLVNTKLYNLRENDKKAILQVVNTALYTHRLQLSFIGASLFYLKDSDIDILLNEIKDKDKDGKLTEYVSSLRSSLKEAWVKAIKNSKQT